MQEGQGRRAERDVGHVWCLSRNGERDAWFAVSLKMLLRSDEQGLSGRCRLAATLLLLDRAASESIWLAFEKLRKSDMYDVFWIRTRARR